MSSAVTGTSLATFRPQYAHSLSSVSRVKNLRQNRVVVTGGILAYRVYLEGVSKRSSRRYLISLAELTMKISFTHDIRSAL